MVLVNFQTDLPNTLRALRRDKGLSQDEAVKELGIARNTLSLYETGKLTPSLDNLIKLLDFYGYRVTIKIEKKATPEEIKQRIDDRFFEEEYD